MALAFACLVASAAPASAAPGQLDGFFAGDGWTTVNFGGNADSASGVAITPGGRVLAGGDTNFGPTPHDIAGVALTADGEPDPAFSGNGLATAQIDRNNSAAAVALQPDGKLVIVGTTEVDPGPGAATDWDFALARFNPNGSLDASFSGDGYTTTTFLGVDQSHAVALDGAGRIVVAGTTRDPDDPGSNDRIAVARFSSNGSLDPSFSGDGRLTAQFGSYDTAFGVAVDSAGRVLTVGGTSPDDISVSRFTPDGSPDTTFSGDGIAAIDFGSHALGWDLAIAPDGKIVAAGHMLADEFDLNMAYDFAAARLTPDGGVDSSFSGDGTQSVHLGGSDLAIGVAISPEGKTILAGGTNAGANPGNGALVRLTANGLRDQSFSSDGATLFDSGSFDGFDDVALDPEGRIVVGGTTGAGETPRNFLIARYEGDPVSIDTMIDSAPPPATNAPAPQFGFSSGSPGVVGFECSLDGGAFASCGTPFTATDLIDGAHRFEVRAVNTIQSRDQTPAEHEFELDTKLLVEIESKEIRLSDKGRAAVKLRCPESEATGPCRGKLKLRTRKKIGAGGGKKGRRSLAAAKRRIVLGSKGFSIAAGRTEKLRLALSSRKRRLVRGSPAARKALAIAKARDGAGNRRKVTRKVKLSP